MSNSLLDYIDNGVFNSLSSSALLLYIEDNKITTSTQLLSNLLQEYFNRNPSYGYLYCIHHHSYKVYGNNVYKLGQAGNIEHRIAGYTTYYIGPVELKHASLSINFYKFAEIVLFKKLRTFRIVPNREFFDCEFDIIKNAINDIAVEFSTDTIVNIINKYNINALPIFEINNKIIAMFEYFIQLDKHIKCDIITINQEDTCNIYDWLTFTKLELSQDNILAVIVNDDEIFKGCINALPLYCNKNIMESCVISLESVVCFNKDNRIRARIELLNWIENYFAITRFEIDKISITDHDINLFVIELKKLKNLLPAIVDSQVTALKRVNDRAYKKLNHLVRKDRIQKFIADIYNMFDKIILFDIIIKQPTINGKKMCLTFYDNFRYNDVTLDYHKKFISKLSGKYKLNV